MTEISLNSKLYKYICEMFLDEVPVCGIAKHFGIKSKEVKKVLTEQFGDEWENQKRNKRATLSLTMPKITEPDLFACQLALLANISERHFYSFVATVRENYPDTCNGVDTTTNKFRTTPDIDNEETDLECHASWYPAMHVWEYRNKV